jgi:hypothetical protein
MDRLARNVEDMLRMGARAYIERVAAEFVRAPDVSRQRRTMDTLMLTMGLA